MCSVFVGYHVCDSLLTSPEADFVVAWVHSLPAWVNIHLPQSYLFFFGFMFVICFLDTDA